jgi:hypothetical protein
MLHCNFIAIFDRWDGKNWLIDAKKRLACGLLNQLYVIVDLNFGALIAGFLTKNQDGH